MNKRYMVLKFVKQVGSAAKEALEVVPMMGLQTRHAAEASIVEMQKADPEATYWIQEVGAA